MASLADCFSDLVKIKRPTYLLGEREADASTDEPSWDSEKPFYLPSKDMEPCFSWIALVAMKAGVCTDSTLFNCGHWSVAFCESGISSFDG